jgi:hypothetical protein
MKLETPHLFFANLYYSPLDIQPRQLLANPAPLRIILWFCLDSNPLSPSQTIQIPQLDPPSGSLRSRSTTLGTDMVGNIFLRPIPPLGW